MIELSLTRVSKGLYETEGFALRGFRFKLVVQKNKTSLCSCTSGRILREHKEAHRILRYVANLAKQSVCLDLKGTPFSDSADKSLSHRIFGAPSRYKGDGTPSTDEIQNIVLKAKGKPQQVLSPVE